jgi:butyryl-CoA dehydrogenase
MSAEMSQARTFADSVAGVLDRHQPATITTWSPGALETGPHEWTGLTAALDTLDWAALTEEPDLLLWAGLAGIELGRRAAPITELDRLLGLAPLVDELIRCAVPSETCVQRLDGELVQRPIVRSEREASADGLDVHRVRELGDPVAVDPELWDAGWNTWLAASTGYLAGLGRGALELTVDYVRGRSAFGSTLAALAPVQQLLAGAVTAVDGVSELAAASPDADALSYAGPAISSACAACHQVSGGIGYTREYPLHRFTQRARALSTWNTEILERISG